MLLLKECQNLTKGSLYYQTHYQRLIQKISRKQLLRKIFQLRTNSSNRFTSNRPNICFYLLPKLQIKSSKTTNVVVTNITDLQQILKILKLKQHDQSNKEPEVLFVNLKWIIDANKSGTLPKCLQSTYFIGSTNRNTVIKV